MTKLPINDMGLDLMTDEELLGIVVLSLASPTHYQEGDAALALSELKERIEERAYALRDTTESLFPDGLEPAIYQDDANDPF